MARIVGGAALLMLIAGGARAEDDFLIEDVPAPVEAAAPAGGALNTLEVGYFYQSRPAARFGRYDGRVDGGGGLDGSVELLWRDTGPNGDGRWGRADGRHLGLSSRSLSAAGGRQGRWGVWGRYDETPYAVTDHAKSLYDTGGETVPFLAAFTVPNGAGTGQGSAPLLSSLADIQLGTLRQSLSGGVTMSPDRQWKVRAEFKHEHKDGAKAASLYWGASPASTMAAGGGGAVFFGETVDYDTDGVRAVLGYDTPRLQGELAYGVSVFRDNARFNRLANPFSTGNRAADSAVYGLPPSTMAHDLAFDGAVRLSEASRLNLALAVGQQFQNDPFLDVTTKSGGSISRASLEGRVDTLFLNTTLTTRPARAMDLKAAYSLDQRDNRTPVTAVSVLAGDYYLAGTNEAKSHLTKPYSFRSQTARLEAGYRLDPQTRASLSYGVSRRERTLLAVSQDQEHSLAGRINRRIGVLSAWVSASQDWRDGGQYRSPEVAPYTQHRVFYMADRERSQAKLGATASFAGSLSAGLSAGMRHDRYPESDYGLHDADGWTATADLGWHPDPALSAAFFYTFDDKTSDSVSCALNCASSWAAEHADQVQTVGMNGQWQAVEERLSLGADYTLTHAVSGTNLRSTSASAQNALLQWGTQRTIAHSLALHADWTLRPGMTLRLGYAWEYLSATDPLVDGWGANMAGTSVTNMLTAGEGEGGYVLHLVTLGFRLRW